MMQILPRWIVTIRYADRALITFSISEHSSANVLRKVADLDFASGATEQPEMITITSENKPPMSNSGVTQTITRG